MWCFDLLLTIGTFMISIPLANLKYVVEFLNPKLLLNSRQRNLFKFSDCADFITGLLLTREFHLRDYIKVL